MKIGITFPRLISLSGRKTNPTGVFLHHYNLARVLSKIDEIDLYAINLDREYSFKNSATISISRNPFKARRKLISEGLDILHINRFPLTCPWLLGTSNITVATSYGFNPKNVLREGYENWKGLSKIFYRKLINFVAIRYVDRIFPPTTYGAQTLKKSLNIDPEKIKIIPLGVNLDHFKPTPRENMEKYNVGKRYFLHVAKKNPRKNWKTLFRAFKELSKKEDVELVVVGSGWENAKTDNSKIKILGRVPDSDLPILYSNTIALVNPSLQEGFGLPFLEAMACGSTVVGSKNTAMPEVIGNAGILLQNPRSKKELQKALFKLLKDTEWRSKLENRGLKRAKKYSWENIANQVYNTYKSLLHKTI